MSRVGESRAEVAGLLRRQMPAPAEGRVCGKVGNRSESIDTGGSGPNSRCWLSVQVAILFDEAADHAGELRSLRDWLRADDGFVGTVDLDVSRPRVGEMGVLGDSLNVVLGPADIAALATALSVWLRSRKSDLRVRLRSGEREVEVDATNVDDPERFVELVREELA